MPRFTVTHEQSSEGESWHVRDAILNGAVIAIFIADSEGEIRYPYAEADARAYADRLNRRHR